MTQSPLRRRTAHGVLVLVVLGACSDSGDGPTTSATTTTAPALSTSADRTTTSTEVTTTTAPDDEAEEAVLDAYQGYFDAILAANDPPDQFHPALRQFATGEAFQSVFEAAQGNRLAERALRLPENSRTEHRAEVISIEGEQATVRDCAVDDGLVVSIETGEVLNDEVTTRLVTGTLVMDEGQWKVSNTSVEQSWEGVAGCAAG
jgi:hypothetical protein